VKLQKERFNKKTTKNGSLLFNNNLIIKN